MDDSITIEETEVNSEFEEVFEAFNEMHKEAQRLTVSNNKLRSDLKLHITKLASTQSELDKLRPEMKNLFQAIKPLVVLVHLPLLIWMITNLCKLSLKSSKRITMQNV